MTAARISLDTLMATVGLYVGPTFGVSMRPMLKEGRDSVVICKKTERLQKADVALYKRGEQYILHRVIAVTEIGYLIRGDSCYSDETVAEDAVIGVLTCFYRGSRKINCSDFRYHTYVAWILGSYRLRRSFLGLKNRIHRWRKG